MSKRSALWFLLLYIFLGVGLRSWELTARSLWFDEAFSWRLIGFSWPEMAHRVTQENNPPLYFVALKAWSAVFGSSAVGLRSYSVTMAAAAIGAMYGLVNYATRSRSAGLLAAWLLAISAWQIPVAWEARMYSQAVALALLASWALLVAVRRNRLAWWLLYALAAAALAYTHYFSWFTLAAHALFVTGYIVSGTRGRIGEIFLTSLFWQAAAAAGTSILLFLPWLPYFWRQFHQVQEAFWVPPLGGWVIPDTFYRMWLPTATIPVHTGWGWVTTPLPMIFTGLVLFTVLRIRGSDREARWLIVVAGTVPFILSAIVSLVGQSIYQDRYLVLAHVFLVAALAILVHWIRVYWLKRTVILVLTLGSLWGLAAYWQELDIAHRPGTRAAIEWVAGQYQTGEAVVVSSSYIFLPVDHYIQEEFPSLMSPRLFSSVAEVKHFAGAQVLTADDALDPDFFTTGISVWVIDTTGFGSTLTTVPPPWKLEDRRSFPEVFGYQGDVIVTKYVKTVN